MKDNKLMYDTLNDIYKNTLEQLKFSETKNNILTTIILTITLLYIRYYYFIKDDLDCSLFYKSIFFGMFLLLLAALLTILKSFYPNLDNNELEKSNDNKNINIYFFKDLVNLKKEEYLHIVSDKTNIKEFDNREQLLDLSNQTITLSKITIFKLGKFKSAIKILGIFFTIFILFYTLMYWNLV